MRVIAGTARGMHLAAPHGNKTRPTSAKVREALFGMLENSCRIADARVLDLFSGTGALGLEALSRGAASVVFVESSRQALESLRKNIVHTRFESQAIVVARDVLRYLEHAVHCSTPFDLIFMDPPYQDDLYISCLELIAQGGLAIDGMLVAELSARAVLPDQVGPLVRVDRRVYGDTALVFYARERTDAAQ